MRDLNTFFKKIYIYQKWKYYREEKQDFKRFLIFLNIKMSAKSKKNLNSMKSLELCGEKNRASGMLGPLCIETKMKKTKA